MNVLRSRTTASCIRLFTEPSGIPSVSAASWYLSPWNITSIEHSLEACWELVHNRSDPLPILGCLQLLAGTRIAET